MKSRVSELCGDPNVDLTPMIDVTFQLIIFFMVVSALARMENEARLVLPVAVQSYVEENPDRRRLVVNIERPGAIVIFGETHTPKSLGALLTREFATLKDVEIQAAREGWARTAPIVIRADKLCRYENIKVVLAAIQKAGFENLQFAAYKDPSTAIRAIPSD